MTFRFGRLVRSSSGPGGRQGRLRREPLAELDQLARGALAERLTVAAPRLVGEAFLGGLAMQTIDSIVCKGQTEVRVAEHRLVPFLRSRGR